MNTLSKERQLQKRISEILNDCMAGEDDLGKDINLERLLLAMQIICFWYGWQNGQIYNASNYSEKGIKYILNQPFNDQSHETQEALYKLFNIE
jgi:hypothetical protein